MDKGTKRARGAQPGNSNGVKHGHYGRVGRGYNSINGQTHAGKEAKRWRRWALEQKGNGKVPYHIRQEINLSMFDLWLLIELGGSIAEDARQRGTALNRRRKTLPAIHQQYETIANRFSRRCQVLKLDDNGQLDLARRLTLEKAGG
jgi:hypothetical protein